MSPGRKTLAGLPQPPQLDEEPFTLVRRKGSDRPTLVSRQTPTEIPRACRLEVTTQIVRKRDGTVVFEDQTRSQSAPAPTPTRPDAGPYRLVALVWLVALAALAVQVMR